MDRTTLLKSRVAFLHAPLPRGLLPRSQPTQQVDSTCLMSGGWLTGDEQNITRHPLETLRYRKP